MLDIFQKQLFKQNVDKFKVIFFYSTRYVKILENKNIYFLSLIDTWAD